MRLWPQKKWKQILLVFFLAVVVIGAVLLGYVGLSINRDVISPIDVLNAGGGKTALVVYQPGLTSLPKDTSYAFADGLASSGWRVEVTTASSQAPSDFSNYSLLVLAFPIYAGGPGAAEVRYVDRLEDLHGIHTVIIDVPASENAMKQKVQAENGVVIGSLVGNGNATDVRQAGSQIAP